MKIAVFTVSTPTYTPEEAVKKLKELGYDGVEWRVIDQPPSDRAHTFWNNNLCTLPLSTIVEKAPEYKQLAADAGLETPAMATYVKCDDPEHAELAMKGAAAMGIPQLRIQVPNYHPADAFKPIWDAARQQYKTIAELAAKHGVKALVETHHRSICPSASAARLFLDGLDPDHVGVIHDAGNMVYEGYEAYRLGLEMLGPYLAHVHVKNARWFPKRYLPDGTLEWMCDAAPVPVGVANLRALCEALDAVGYDEWITLEDFSTEHPLDHRLENNLAYLRGVLQAVKEKPVRLS